MPALAEALANLPRTDFFCEYSSSERTFEQCCRNVAAAGQPAQYWYCDKPYEEVVRWRETEEASWEAAATATRRWKA